MQAYDRVVLCFSWWFTSLSINWFCRNTCSLKNPLELYVCKISCFLCFSTTFWFLWLAVISVHCVTRLALYFCNFFLLKVFILFVSVKICNVCRWKDSRCCRFSKLMCSYFYLDFFCLSLHSFSCTKSLKLITKESSLGVFPGQENSSLNMKCRVLERGMKRKHSM